MSGSEVKLTDKQSSALQQLKVNVKDVNLEDIGKDSFLVKWLTATNYNAKKAEEMIRQSVIWRQKNGTDTILDDWTPPQVLKDYYPCGLAGFDKEGAPVWLDLIGRRDYKGLLHSAMKSDIIKYEMQIIERLSKLEKEQSAKLGKRIDQTLVILDLDQMGLQHLWKPGLETYTDVMTLLEANYPCSNKAVYITNTPRFFPLLYSLIKPFLSAETKSNLHVLGSNWKEKLLEVIPADQLPVNWGGTRTDPDGDPFCKSTICIGGEVPKSLYSKNCNDDRSSWSTVTIGSKDTYQHLVTVDSPGSIIRYEFQTDDHDIGFGVYRKKSPEQNKLSEMEVIKETERVHSHMVTQNGGVTCEQEGIYVIAFDNSFSWTKSKKVQYNMDVIAPSENDDLD